MYTRLFYGLSLWYHAACKKQGSNEHNKKDKAEITKNEA